MLSTVLHVAVQNPITSISRVAQVEPHASLTAYYTRTLNQEHLLLSWVLLVSLSVSVVFDGIRGEARPTP
jgi:hypothetical protein